LKDYNQTICFSCLLIFTVNCKYFLYILFSSTVNIYLLSSGIKLGKYSNWQEAICNIWKR
jgi:hypothetical protein